MEATGKLAEMARNERPNDNYEEYLSSVTNRFDTYVGDGKSTLFTTDAEGLFDIFLDNLPTEARQHYECNTCRSFINHYGSLVLINEDGTIETPLYGEVPEFFKKASAAMRSAVLSAKVTGIFIPESIKLGISKTGIWEHLSVKVPRSMLNTQRGKTAGQVMAEKRENFSMLNRALLKYDKDIASRALTLLQSGALYRSDKAINITEWFHNLYVLLEGVKDSKIRTNLIWLTISKSPDEFCHVNSGMLGTLLEDVQNNLPTATIASRFKDKMSTYQRSQSAPTINQIQNAEKLISDYGLENSLARRYATFDEIPYFLWKNNHSVKQAEKSSAGGGIFSSIIPKDAQKELDPLTLPSTTMTWAKFSRDVLPTAQNIELSVDDPNRFVALVTAAIPDSENILQWDNPFSWYYHGGIDGEIKRRVEAAGGKYENNEIRCSLLWNNYSDLDLHCITPRGHEIYYGVKGKNIDGGNLDVDANVSGDTLTPVENIRWASNAPAGHYRFFVVNYTDRGYNNNPFKVELEINGTIYVFNGILGREKSSAEVFEFDYYNGQVTNMKSSSSTISASGSTLWEIQPRTFTKVTGITTSPNLWGENPVTHTGTHIFFLLDGCKDLSEGKGRGFFNETLKGELREIRKVLEAYTATTPIENADEASACGVGFSKDNDWNLIVRVTANNSTRIIKIDRYE